MAIVHRARNLQVHAPATVVIITPDAERPWIVGVRAPNTEVISTAPAVLVGAVVPIASIRLTVHTGIGAAADGFPRRWTNVLNRDSSLVLGNLTAVVVFHEAEAKHLRTQGNDAGRYSFYTPQQSAKQKARALNHLPTVPTKGMLTPSRTSTLKSTPTTLPSSGSVEHFSSIGSVAKDQTRRSACHRPGGFNSQGLQRLQSVGGGGAKGSGGSFMAKWLPC